MEQVKVHETTERGNGHGRPVSTLVRELRDDVMTLFRQETELGKAEVSEKISRSVRNAIYLGAGAFIALLGLIYLVQGLVFLLGNGLVAAGMAPALAEWLSPIIIGAAITIVGVILALKGNATLKKESVVPDRTVHSIREDIQWARKKRH